MASVADGTQSPFIDLRSLVAHTTSVPAEMTIEAAQAEFARANVDFLAVINQGTLLGVCARRELTQALGSRFGFSIYARQPVRGLLMAAPMIVRIATEVTEVFKIAAARADREFYDDVLLLDEEERYAGMVPMRTLVRLQTEFLLGNIDHLEASRQKIALHNREMEEDLLMAREVQIAMLPAQFRSNEGTAYTLRIAHRFRPAHGVSGDFFILLPFPDQSVGVLVCDVMGHGVRSALITAMIRAFVEELRPVAGEPAAFLTRLNHNLTALLRQTGSLIFVTSAYALIDLSSQRLRYAQAGHPSPLFTEHATGLTQPVNCPADAAGPALGLMDDFEYIAVEQPFIRGDRILLFTDGVTEAPGPGGEEFGVDRLGQFLTREKASPIEAMIDRLLVETIAFAGDALPDDFCAVAVEFA